VVYQVYPRSFADSDGDGIGDLPGATARLDHLNDGTPRSLGVDAIWLSPFYPSPMADFGYDVADYTGVDPLFGTLADADRLIEEAHRRGIRVILDWVPNHTSDRHPWFAASRSSPRDPMRDWYVWRDGAADDGPPDGLLSAFERVGPAWTHDPATGQWYRHSFTPQQPDLNWDHPEAAAAMLDTLRFWLDRGVDGFRVDVAHLLGLDVLRRMRRVLDEYEGRMAVGEVYLLDQRALLPFLNDGSGLDLAHNFVFLRAPWRARRFRAVIDEFDRLAVRTVWPSWFLSNHDHSRVATRYDEGGHGPARARAAAMLVLGLRGTAFLFQGEELGLPDAVVPPGRRVDVGGRDPERAPIPWEPPSVAGPGAGFTTGEPWLPLAQGAETLAAAVQRDDPRSTLSLYRRLLWLRRDTPALRTGAQRLVDAGPGVLAWLREGGREAYLVAINMGARPRRIDAPGARAARLLVSSDPDRGEGAVPVRGLRLAPDEGVLLRLGRPG